MTRVQARRRKRRSWRAKQIAAWTLVFAVEILAAAAQAAVVGAVLIPTVNAHRGYGAFGGEWLLLAGLFCGAYFIIHNRVCNKIFEEGKHG